MSIDPQVQALLPRLPGLRPQCQQAQEDAPEPESGGSEGAPPGHAAQDLLAAGELLVPHLRNLGPSDSQLRCSSLSQSCSRLDGWERRFPAWVPRSLREQEEEGAGRTGEAGVGGTSGREPCKKVGRGREWGWQRRKTGKAGEAGSQWGK